MGDRIRYGASPHADVQPGTTWTDATVPNPNYRLNVSAQLEPDADSDGYGDESQDSCPSDAAIHAGPCQPDLTVTKTASRAMAIVGDNIAYSIGVSSNGAATGATMTDTLPSGASFVSASSTVGTCGGTSTVSCSFGDLPNGATATVTILVKTTSAGLLTNTASAASATPDSNLANNSASASTSVAAAVASAPVLSGLSLSPSKFRAAGSGPSIATSVGTTVRYTLSAAAAVEFRVERAAKGRRVKGRCVKPTRSNATRKPCTRYVTLRGSFTHEGQTGSNKFKFRGRLGGHTLKPGSYRLRAVATDASGQSSVLERIKFRIVKH